MKEMRELQARFEDRLKALERASLATKVARGDIRAKRGKRGRGRTSVADTVANNEEDVDDGDRNGEGDVEDGNGGTAGVDRLDDAEEEGARNNELYVSFASGVRSGSKLTFRPLTRA